MCEGVWRSDRRSRSDRHGEELVLDRRTSLEFAGTTAYLVPVSGVVHRFEGLCHSDRPLGRHQSPASAQINSRLSVSKSPAHVAPAIWTIVSARIRVPVVVRRCRPQSAKTSRVSCTKKLWSWPLLVSSAL